MFAKLHGLQSANGDICKVPRSLCCRAPVARRDFPCCFATLQCPAAALRPSPPTRRPVTTRLSIFSEILSTTRCPLALNVWGPYVNRVNILAAQNSPRPCPYRVDYRLCGFYAYNIEYSLKYVNPSTLTLRFLFSSCWFDSGPFILSHLSKNMSTADFVRFCY